MQARLFMIAITMSALLALPDTGEAQRRVLDRIGDTAVVVPFAEGLEHPWSLEFLPDGRGLVTERPGRLRYVDRQGRLSAPLAGVPDVYDSGQGGLLDVALDPDFGTSRVIYFSYAETGTGGAGTAVARARLGERSLDEVQVIFRQRPKTGGRIHFGSRLVFAPDGTLFVTLGERNQRDRAQDLSNHLGKLVRINPDGSVPSDNPFVNRPGALPEIWSYGHRNMQGAALNPWSGKVWTHEHGARGGDEINELEAGLNYGWPVITHGVDYSGFPIGIGSEAPGMEQPLHHWTPSIAPSGMMFYFGDAFPDWRGDLFVGALNPGRLVRLELRGKTVTREHRYLGRWGERIRDVRQGPDDFIYLLVDSGDGAIVRVEPAS